MPRPKDETYIVDLCDRYTGLQAVRGHRFDFLVGDPDKRGRRIRLPVDAYYRELELVIEYHERQHSEHVPFFDERIVRPGVTRSEQRRKYDLLRREILPQHSITPVVLDYREFDCDRAKRLLRVDKDYDVIARRLSEVITQKKIRG